MLDAFCAEPAADLLAPELLDELGDALLVVVELGDVQHEAVLRERVHLVLMHEGAQLHVKRQVDPLANDDAQWLLSNLERPSADILLATFGGVPTANRARSDRRVAPERFR